MVSKAGLPPALGVSSTVPEPARAMKTDLGGYYSGYFGDGNRNRWTKVVVKHALRVCMKARDVNRGIQSGSV